MKTDLSPALPFVDPEVLEKAKEDAVKSYNLLLSRKGAGKEFLGWLDLPAAYSPEEVSRIRSDAEKIRAEGRLLVVIGIGGSYLGARAVIDGLSHHFEPFLPSDGNTRVVYAGENLSGDYHADLLSLLDRNDYSVCVISKSGTTTEPAVAFRILRSHLEKKYGKAKASARIYAVTDRTKGALRKMAEREGYATYNIPDDVGGRYSVLTPVGLLPVAAAGFSIERLLEGAGSMRNFLTDPAKIGQNPAIGYAMIRNAFYRTGKTTEVMVGYEPRLFWFTEWWKQLYGESEGKEGRGIFPAGVTFTTDLHSMGQYLQEGLRNIFETVLSVDEPRSILKVPPDPADEDGLNFLSGRSFTEINRVAESATMLAHIDGGVPNIRISVPRLDEFHLGQLIYFFEFACAVSGYTLGINPFDQPGVEAYKRNMFSLLGKPGFEAEGKALRERLGG